MAPASTGPTLTALGYTVAGLDISERQLSIATQKNRIHRAVLGDVVEIPFSSSTFDLVVSTYTHTDIDDWTQAMREVSRVLTVGGSFVYVGPHPCFFGAQAEKLLDGTVKIHAGYYNGGDRVVYDAPGFSDNGLRQKVGERHLSLARFLNSILVASLTLVLQPDFVI